MKNLSFKGSAVLTILLLMGCSVAPVSTDTVVAQQLDGETTNIKSAGNDVSMNRPVVIPPPGLHENSIQSETNNETTTINGLPALSASKGLKIESLFNEELKDMNMRFKRLEEAHIAFRKEYELIKPAIVRLASIEDDLQVLMSELNGFVDEQTAPQPASPPLPIQNITPKVVEEALLEPSATNVPSTSIASIVPILAAEAEDKAVVLPETIKTDMSLDSSTLKDIRIGKHPDKIRIVFETNTQSEYSLDLNNDDKLMTISFLNTVRDDGLEAESIVVSNPLLSSYEIKQQDNAVQVVIRLKRASRVQREEVISAKTAQNNNRIVIDLAL